MKPYGKFKGPLPIHRGNLCVEWSGSRTKDGYGKVHRVDRIVYVHRAIWIQVNGSIPDGLDVLHRCDNPPCFNLDHLFLGTHADNMHDMFSKERGTKLKIADVRIIRKLLQQGVSQYKIAAQFGVTQCQINYINTGRTWNASTPWGAASQLATNTK